MNSIDNCGASQDIAPNPQPVCNFRIKWKVDTGKCVDASPLVVQWINRLVEQSLIVFVGSHSGLFMAIDFNTGDVLWNIQLGDRIESSACISKCSQYIIVGMYSTIIVCVCV